MAAENHHSFKQTNQVFTIISHLELDALWTHIQPVLLGCRFFFFWNCWVFIVVYFLYFFPSKLLKILDDFLWSFFFRRCEPSLSQPRHHEPSIAEREARRRDASCTLTPVMRALIEMEETRATESRAPCKNSSNTHSVTHTHSQDVRNQEQLIVRCLHLIEHSS